MGLYILLGLFGVIAIGFILIFNRLVKLRQFVNSGWSDIDVQLKRRADLIPRLIETVKGYAAHERNLFAEVTQRRNGALAAGNDPAARAGAEAALGRGASRLVALAESYPDLKASDNFLDLQNELSETEDKIEMARRYYNGSVRNMNTAVQSFPVNMIAPVLGFSQRDYFEISDSDRAAPSMDGETF